MGYDSTDADVMPTVNISDQDKDRIKRIKEHSKWNPSNKEIVGKALEMFEEEIVEQETENQNTQGGN